MFQQGSARTAFHDKVEGAAVLGWTFQGHVYGPPDLDLVQVRCLDQAQEFRAKHSKQTCKRILTSAVTATTTLLRHILSWKGIPLRPESHDHRAGDSPCLGPYRSRLFATSYELPSVIFHHREHSVHLHVYSMYGAPSRTPGDAQKTTRRQPTP